MATAYHFILALYYLPWVNSDEKQLRRDGINEPLDSLNLTFILDLREFGKVHP